MTLTLLIDLDDTLLPDSSDKFLPIYLKRLSEYLSDLAAADEVYQALMSATMYALQNPAIDSSLKELFDTVFYPALGVNAEDLEDRLVEFYTEQFPEFSPIDEPPRETTEFIQGCLDRGYRLAIATNPIFPRMATYERLRWAGITPDSVPLELVSTYEDFHFGKPHPAYYLELIAQLGWPESGFVMVGDDLQMDIEPARALGIPAYQVIPGSELTTENPNDVSGPLDQVHSWLDKMEDEIAVPDLGGAEISRLILQAVPAALDTILRGLPIEAWSESPEPGDWNLTEVVCHLRDVDREVHLTRMISIRDDADPFLPAIDADSWAAERSYRLQDGEQALRDFLQYRKQLLALVDDLLPNLVEKDIKHSIFGPITLGEILRIAARHDTLHVQQAHALLNA